MTLRPTLLSLSLALAACSSTPTVAVDDGAARRLKADVAWLADDARAGRRAGTDGEHASARWLARRFEELGLEPAGVDGYLQRFDVPLPIVDRGGSRIEFEGGAIEGARSILPLFCSADASALGEVVFLGYGIESSEVEWNDFAGLEGERPLAGKVALIVRGSPPVDVQRKGDAKDTQLVTHGDGFGSGATIFAKVMAAKRRGAAAVAIAQHPRADEPLPPFDSSRNVPSEIPAVAIVARSAERLIADFAARVAAIDASKRPSAPAPTGVQAEVRGDVQRAKGPAYNVLARLRGATDERAIVIGAHFDHLGDGDVGSLAPKELGSIHNGADDNASGTAAVLEIARELRDGPPTPCDVIFALWSGEELGLIGSKHWVEQSTVPIERVRAKINLDMVGRAGGGKLQVLGGGTAVELEPMLRAAGERAGLELTISSSGQGVGGSDHQSFLQRQIPAVHLFSGVHSDYHKPSDDVERVEIDGVARVVALSVALARDLGAAESLAYVEPKVDAEKPGQQRVTSGWRVWFGTVPSYTFEGKGMKLDGTSAGSPAEKAGLLRDDVIVQVGDVPVASVYDFMYALQLYKPGDTVLTRFLRDGAEESVRVTLTTRDAQ